MKKTRPALRRTGWAGAAGLPAVFQKEYFITSES